MWYGFIQAGNPFFILTHKQADAHSTPGHDAGDLKGPAALRAHQTVPCLQAALGTFAPGA